MFMPLIRSRRSVRKFSDRPVEPEKVEQLTEAALRAPSSRSLNPWEFVVVDEPATLDTLSRSKPHGSSFLKNAPLGIVICADSGKSDVWVEDASIATIYIQLAAASLQLGSCWIQIRKRMHAENTTAEAFVAETLQLPEHLSVESIVAIGYPGEDKKPHPAESLQKDKVFFNLYGSR